MCLYHINHQETVHAYVPLAVNFFTFFTKELNIFQFFYLYLNCLKFLCTLMNMYNNYMLYDNKNYILF